MLPEEAINMHRDVRAEHMLPIHWSTFNMALHDWDEPIERILAAAEPFRIPVMTPRIGERINLGQQREYPTWWRR